MGTIPKYRFWMPGTWRRRTVANINALGPNITGNTIEDEEVARAESVKIDGRTYYQYSLETPYAKLGAHQLASISAKDEAVLLLALSASEAQWKSSKDDLIKIQESFRVL